MVEREERVVERDVVRDSGPESGGPGRSLIIGVVAALLVAGLIVVLIFAANEDDDGGTQTDDIELEAPEAPDVEAPDDVDVNIDDDTEE